MALWHFSCIVLPCGSKGLVQGRAIAVLDGDLWGERKADEVLRRLDALGRSRALWSDDVVIWGEADGTSVQLSSHAGIVEEVCVRVDMRNPDVEFVGLLLGVAKDNEWVLYSEDCETIDANLADVLEAARRSQASRFCEDPGRYMSDVALRAIVGEERSLDAAGGSGDVDDELSAEPGNGKARQ